MRSLLATKLYVAHHPQGERELQNWLNLGLDRWLTQDPDDRLVRNNGGISEPEFRLAPTIAYVSHHSQHPLRAYNHHQGLDARCAAVRKSPECDAQAAEKPTCSISSD